MRQYLARLELLGDDVQQVELLEVVQRLVQDLLMVIN